MRRKVQNINGHAMKIQMLSSKNNHVISTDAKQSGEISQTSRTRQSARSPFRVGEKCQDKESLCAKEKCADKKNLFIKIAVTFLLLLTTTLTSIAQDYNKDISEVISNIETATSCHIQSTITVYNNKEKKYEIMSFGSELKKSEESYRSKIATTELISDGKMMIMVDHDEKVVQLEKLPKLSKKDKKFMEEFYDLESSEKNIDTILFIASKEGVNEYQIDYKYGEIKQMNIFLNTQSQTIKRIEFEYNKKLFPDNNYVVIDYTKFSFESSFDKGIFSGKDLMNKKGKGFVLLDKYNKYQLIDLYNE